MTDDNSGTYALQSVNTFDVEIDVTEVKERIDETITIGSLDDSVDCDSIQFGTSGRRSDTTRRRLRHLTEFGTSVDTTPTSSYENNGRLTFIDDAGDAYEPDGFKVTDEDNGAMRVSIPDQFFPPKLAGVSPQSMQRWEVVITQDGETRTGFVMEAEHSYNKNKFTLSVDP